MSEMNASALKKVVMEGSGIEIDSAVLAGFSSLLTTIAAGLDDPTLVISRETQPAFMQFGR